MMPDPETGLEDAATTWQPEADVQATRNRNRNRRDDAERDRSIRTSSTAHSADKAPAPDVPSGLQATHPSRFVLQRREPPLSIPHTPEPRQAM